MIRNAFINTLNNINWNNIQYRLFTASNVGEVSCRQRVLDSFFLFQSSWYTSSKLCFLLQNSAVGFIHTVQGGGVNRTAWNKNGRKCHLIPPIVKTHLNVFLFSRFSCMAVWHSLLSYIYYTVRKPKPKISIWLTTV